PTTVDLQMQNPLEEGLTYEVQSVVPETNYQVMNDAVPGNLGGEYADPGIVSPAVRDLLDAWTRDAETPFQQLLAIQTRLRAFEYSTSVDNEASSDYLARFLLETKAGYCQQFATAFALLARELGMEARVSVGFLPGSTSPSAPNQYVVRGTDAHAWPEVYFEDLGWISFEPTPRELTTPPGYTIQGGGTTPVGVNLQSERNRFVDPALREGGNNLQDFRDPAGAARGPADPTGAEDRGPTRWETAFANLLRVLTFGAIAFLLAVPLLKETRRKRRYARADGTRSRATAAFLDFEDAAAELASPRADAESAVAYVSRIARSHRVPRPPAIRLARIFEAAQYAPREIPPNQAVEAQRLASQLRRNLWSEATWWERASRLFSPTRLVGRQS
ncbi:MAG: transglutaminase domain-containing protein, partial [Actinobacteria bacterium]|nr:transglutaminase domain-containing protein [Actinomycetota bacterium]